MSVLKSITLCGSMSSTELKNAILETGKDIEKHGFSVIYPSMGELGAEEYRALSPAAAAAHKSRLIQDHFAKIQQSDAILVVNPTKRGVSGYVGSNTLMEMAVAFYLKKPIFLLNEPDATQGCYPELMGMAPIILHGQITKLKSPA